MPGFYSQYARYGRKRKGRVIYQRYYVVPVRDSKGRLRTRRRKFEKNLVNNYYLSAQGFFERLVVKTKISYRTYAARWFPSGTVRRVGYFAWRARDWSRETDEETRDFLMGEGRLSEAELLAQNPGALSLQELMTDYPERPSDCYLEWYRAVYHRQTRDIIELDQHYLALEYQPKRFGHESLLVSRGWREYPMSVIAHIMPWHGEKAGFQRSYEKKMRFRD
jgi:hypothetical protein